MKNNQIFHANPLDSLSAKVNRSSKELTVMAKFTNLDISALANTDNAIVDAYNLGLPCTTTIPNPSDSLAKLFPVTNHMNHLNGKKGALMYLYFYPISCQSTGGAGFTAEEVNNAIKDSTSVAQHSWGFNQTVIRNSQMVSHQPNWFRPKFVVNDNLDYFDLDETSNEFPTSSPSTIFKPEFAQGLNLPYEENGITKALKVYESINSVDVFAHCYQAIKIGSSIVYQPYFMNCEAKFIIED